MSSGRFVKKWIAGAMSIGIATIAASTLSATIYAQDFPFKPGEKITFDLVGQIKECA